MTHSRPLPAPAKPTSRASTRWRPPAHRRLPQARRCRGAQPHQGRRARSSFRRWAEAPRLAVRRQQLKLVQVTGAGLDRLDQAAMKKLGIAVANVPGGSNSAVAEYAVTAASLLLRRLAWATPRSATPTTSRSAPAWWPTICAGLEGLMVGVVGLGTVGVAVAQRVPARRREICFHDPAPRDEAAAARLGARRAVARRAARDRRRRDAARAAAAADAGLIGARELAPDEARRDPDPGFARRHRQRGRARRGASIRGISAAPRSTSTRPSRPRRTIRCSPLTAKPPSRPAHAAHRGRDAPGRRRRCSARPGRTSSACWCAARRR